MKILNIPDAHCKPRCGIERFKWAANLAAELQPEVILQGGDLFDMPSLCSYDREKVDFKARSYTADLEAGHRALDLFDNMLAQKAPKYKPKRIMLGGNHDEGRVAKLLADDARFAELISVDDFKHEGWEWVPFLNIKNIAGVHFSHYFVSGLMGRPIGGEHHATTMLKAKFVSCVGHHSHLWDYSERTRADGRKICGLVAGCFLEIGQKEDYARSTQPMWANCVTMLHDVKDGHYDPERWSITRLKKAFG